VNTVPRLHETAAFQEFARQRQQVVSSLHFLDYTTELPYSASQCLDGPPATRLSEARVVCDLHNLPRYHPGVPAVRWVPFTRLSWRADLRDSQLDRDRSRSGFTLLRWLQTVRVARATDTNCSGAQLTCVFTLLKKECCLFLLPPVLYLAAPIKSPTL